ncbi:MAG: coiled coil domain-containing protein [Deltaproteobacteria bacterium]|nr:coiled coil domain-containing protein [Deltaproteobacteria bacterium]
METMQTHVGKIETRLRKWGKTLDKLAVKADEAGAEVKADYRKNVDDLKTKHQAARVKLDELKVAGAEKWQTLKTGVEGACNEIEDAYRKLKSSPEK